MALTTIGQLVHGDTIPSSQPRRYKTRAGYIKLRWKVGVRQYVEAYEHRVVCGLPDAHVHHINGNKTDNRIENLQVLPPKDHAGEHRDFDYAAAADMYRSGATTTKVGMAFGVSAGQVSRALRSIGVEMRQPSIPRRTVDLSRVRELHALGMRPRTHSGGTWRNTGSRAPSVS